MVLLWAILFLIFAIILGFIAFGGIAIAISFFSKILLILALLCLLISLILMVIERYEFFKRDK